MLPRLEERNARFKGLALGRIERLEVLRKLETLTLVVGADALAVDLLRRFGKRLIDEAADDLAILEDERDFMAPNFQHGARTLSGA
jgi:hypothetical protein